MGAMPTDLRDLPERADLGRGTRERKLGWGDCRWLMAHRVIACGVSVAGRGFSFARTTPGTSVLMACSGGAGEALVDGAWRRFATGRCYVAPAGALHAYRATRAPWTLAWVCWIEMRGYERILPPGPSRLDAGDGVALTAMIEHLHRELHGARDASSLGHLAALVDAYARRLARRAPRGGRLAAVWSAVESEPARRWRLADLAALAGMGREALRVACQAETGRSPVAQIAALRLRRAAALLDARDGSVATVAASVGYDNPFAFSTAFRRRFGMTPSLYRDRRRGHVRVDDR